MFTVYVNGIIDASLCIDDLKRFGYIIVSAINNDGTWIIKFKNSKQLMSNETQK